MPKIVELAYLAICIGDLHMRNAAKTSDVFTIFNYLIIVEWVVVSLIADDYVLP